MKLLRLWLLVLLAVLLPVRGAMAAAMPCMSVGAGSHGVPHVTGTQPHHGHGHGQDDETHARGAGHAGHGHAGAHHEPSQQDKCSACSACCASPSLPSTPMGIGAPTAWLSVSFPAVSAPAPSFQSDGPERPPRSS